jgi:NDP-sugar pyrophosphorylase family protein
MLTLVVLAAGMGSRYGGLKQIEPVGPNGETLLDYSVFDASRAGFIRVVFVIRRQLEDQFRNSVGQKYGERMEVVYAFQELENLPPGFVVPVGREKPWGTAHAVWCAADAVDSPFAVMNADDFYGAQSFQQLADFFRANTDPCAHAMVAYRLARTLSEFGSVSRGVCTTDPSGKLLRVDELTHIVKIGDGAENQVAGESPRSLSGSELVSMNCWGFQPSVFALLGEGMTKFLRGDGQNAKAEFYLPTAVTDMLTDDQGTVQVLTSESNWFGITYREDKPRVINAIRELVKAGDYPERLWEEKF